MLHICKKKKINLLEPAVPEELGNKNKQYHKSNFCFI